MTDVTVCLDFACLECRKPVGVTLQCTGDPVSLAETQSASVPVPCPHCGLVNKLTFDPDGRVHDVEHYNPHRLPQPSVN